MQPTTLSLAFWITVVAVLARTPGVFDSAASEDSKAGAEAVGSTAMIPTLE